MGLKQTALFKAFSPDGNPTFATVAKVAKALGCKLLCKLLIPPSQVRFT
ncbi:hypothetical protein [Rheinheimera pacifica]